MTSARALVVGMALIALVAGAPALAATEKLTTHIYGTEDDIRKTQEILVMEEYLEEGSFEPGKWDEDTAAAVRKFQVDHFMLANGDLDQDTMGMIISHGKHAPYAWRVSQTTRTGAPSAFVNGSRIQVLEERTAMAEQSAARAEQRAREAEQTALMAEERARRAEDEARIAAQRDDSLRTTPYAERERRNVPGSPEGTYDDTDDSLLEEDDTFLRDEQEPGYGDESESDAFGEDRDDAYGTTAQNRVQDPQQDQDDQDPAGADDRRWESERRMPRTSSPNATMMAYGVMFLGAGLALLLSRRA